MKNMNFNLSIILPFYKKLDVFREVLPLNSRYLIRNGLEVIIVMDDPEGKQGLVELIMDYPEINWILICNERHHEWRNPAKAINSGIRRSSKEHILIMSPESEMLTDLPALLLNKVKNKTDVFASGFFLKKDTSPKKYPYGSILVKRSHLEAIGGYNEEENLWGGEDDNIRFRLEMYGLRNISCPDALVAHHGSSGPEKGIKKNPEAAIKRLLRPHHYHSFNQNWGNESRSLIYNYKDPFFNTWKRTHLNVKGLELEICNESLISKKHKLLCLIQAYNEGHHIQKTLNHLSQHCDGIILLDDGSTDETFKKAEHPALVMKARKKRNKFNDLENRNILLKLSNLASSEWLMFADADERFDSHFPSPVSYTDSQEDIISFRLIHLWDRENTYRTDYPYSNKGIQEKYRMFRHLGYMQIHSQKRLHFPTLPFTADIKHSDVLILHYGRISPELRKQKILFYQKHDTDGSQESYKHLSDTNVKKGSLEKLHQEGFKKPAQKEKAISFLRSFIQSLID